VLAKPALSRAEGASRLGGLSPAFTLNQRTFHYWRKNGIGLNQSSDASDSGGPGGAPSGAMPIPTLNAELDGLAQPLRELADKYDYDGLIRLLEDACRR